ncbi:MAG: SPOR domain-containing protein [Pseudomonadota bacterium]
MHVSEPDVDATAGTGGLGALVAQVARWIGALVSLTLVLGLIVWAYRLGQRDASEVPVIKAMAGAARIAPEDPGGLQAAHQGLAVNEVVATRRVAEPAEDVTLAPPAETVAEEDLPVAALTEPETPVPPIEAEVATPAPEEAPTEESAAEDPAPDGEAEIAAVIAEALASDAVPEAAEPRTPVPPLDADVSRMALAFTEPPLRRPSSLDTARTPTTEEDRAAAGQDPARGPNAEVESTSITAGTDLIQLGAFDTPETARSEWDRIVGNHDAILGSKRRLVEQTTQGGRVFYRLRAVGFADLDEARAACAALSARGQPCNPVKAN